MLIKPHLTAIKLFNVKPMMVIYLMFMINFFGKCEKIERGESARASPKKEMLCCINFSTCKTSAVPRGKGLHPHTCI